MYITQFATNFRGAKRAVSRSCRPYVPIIPGTPRALLLRGIWPLFGLLVFANVLSGFSAESIVPPLYHAALLLLALTGWLFERRLPRAGLAFIYAGLIPLTTWSLQLQPDALVLLANDFTGFSIASIVYLVLAGVAWSYAGILVMTVYVALVGLGIYGLPENPLVSARVLASGVMWGSLLAWVLSHADSAHQALSRAAHTDALTGLPNRLLLYDRLEQTLLSAKRREQRVAVLFLDLDGFKAINDTLGHAAGDALLQEVARRLTNTLRSEDTVARLGGDEFVAVLNIAQLHDTDLIAERLLQALTSPIQWRNETMNVSASIGISTFPNHGEDTDTLLKCADTAMYKAKMSGKNAVRSFEC